MALSPPRRLVCLNWKMPERLVSKNISLEARLESPGTMRAPYCILDCILD